MNKNNLLNLLSDFNKVDVERYISYVEKLIDDGKSLFLNKYNDEKLAELFKRVNKEGLIFDGIHITLQSTGISYDYVALKNKMLLAYPETIIDVNLVYKGDEYEFGKDSGKITYFHKVKDPFNKKDEHIIGAYAIIKNKRGEFLTILGKDEIEKHRKTAKTDYIWKQWLPEMTLKTIMKKACKLHFGDIFTQIEEMDNENYDVNRLNNWQEEIDKIKDYEELKLYFAKNKGQGVEFDKAIAKKKKELLSNNDNNENS